MATWKVSLLWYLLFINKQRWQALLRAKRACYYMLICSWTVHHVTALIDIYIYIYIYIYNCGNYLYKNLYKILFDRYPVIDYDRKSRLSTLANQYYHVILNLCFLCCFTSISWKLVCWSLWVFTLTLYILSWLLKVKNRASFEYSLYDLF